MLQADEVSPSFLEPPHSPVREPQGQARSERIPAAIGKYKVLSVLGKGGTAIVYRARQESPAREVAVKVLRPGLFSKTAYRRLELEATILARLQHQGIAQVFEAGVVDFGAGDQPFFAMEFVAGAPLLEHVKAVDLNTAARIELFLLICEAVAHAHRNGVIHRDLNPNNILVDQHGRPKVLDFGIARVADADLRTTTIQTGMGQLLGTIPYMSPEQTLGDSGALDTRSDVYALGVILYEMLSGRLPYDLERKTFMEAARIIREEEAKPIGTHDRTLRGELEWILAKALEKEPDRRYLSVSDLAGDLRRYLRNEPLLARPASAAYRFRKLARRHPSAVSAFVFGTAALILGLVGMTWQAMRAAAEYERALRAERETAAMTSLLVGVLAEAGTWKVGSGAAVEKLLDALAGKLDTLSADPAPEASLRLALGRSYRAFGATYPTLPQIRKAEAQIRRAHQLRDDHTRTDVRAWIETAVEYAGVLRDLAHLEDAISDEQKRLRDQRLAAADALLQRAATSANGAPFSNDPLMFPLAMGLAARLNDSQRPDEAETLLRKIVANCDLGGPDAEYALEAMSRLATILEQRAEWDEAEKLRRNVVADRERIQGADADDTHTAKLNLASFLWQRGQSDRPDKLGEALTLYRQEMEVSRQNLGRDDPRTLMEANQLGVLLGQYGALEEAEAVHRETLEARIRVLGPNHGNTLRSRVNLAWVVMLRGRLDEAEWMFREVLNLAEHELEPGHIDVGWIERNLGRCLFRAERYEEAEALLVSGYDKLRRAGGEQHRWTLDAIRFLIELYENQGKEEKAAEFRLILEQTTLSPRNALGS